MDPSPLRTSLFRLGNFVVDPMAFTITLGSEAKPVQPKVMDVLLCLVESNGQIVSREYLLQHVWPGVFVVDGALRRCVFLLRKLLSADDTGAEYLETIPRSGYRMLYAAEPLDREAIDNASSVTEHVHIENAYRGLDVYEPEHTHIFFGRNKMIARVVSAMDKQQYDGCAFVLSLGASGCGKSSLLRAGVLPTLQRRANEHQTPLSVLIFQISRSTAKPLHHLVQSLAETLLQSQTLDHDIDQLADLLVTDPETALNILIPRSTKEDTKPASIVILFDQFEEVFSLQSIDESDRTQLFEVLYTLARSGQVNIFAAMRSEFYPQFMSYETLRFLRGEFGQVDVTFPGAAEIADIVQRPAQLAGFRFETDEHGQRLDQVIIQEATSQSKSLPLMQFALHQMEEKGRAKKLFTFAHYKRLGRLEGCLSSHADTIFDGLSKDAKTSLSNVLSKLVVADPRNAGRVLKRSALASEFDHAPGAIELVERFTEGRLITRFFDKSTQQPSVQIAHEAVLRHWERAKEWTQENYVSIKFKQWLHELAHRWEDDGRPSHFLLRDGKPLIEAKQLANDPQVLPQLVRQFVHASSKRVQRRNWVRRSIVVSLAALSLLSVGFAYRSVVNSQQAQQANRLSNATTEFLVSSFESADPGRSGGELLTPADMLKFATENIEGLTAQDPQVHGAVLRVAAELYAKLNQLDRADDILKAAEPLIAQIEPDNPKLAAELILEKGGVLRLRQEYEEANKLFARALTLAKRSQNHRLIGIIHNQSALIYQGMGDHAQAVRLFHLGDTAFSNHQPKDDRLRRPQAELLTNLALSEMLLGNTAEARNILTENLDTLERHNLNTSRPFVHALANLALLYRLEGNFEQAIPLFSKAIELDEAQYGLGTEQAVGWLANRISAELTLERYEDAIRTAESAIDYAQKNPSVPPLTVAILHGKRLIAFDGAKASLPANIVIDAKESLPALEQAFGENHEFVSQCQQLVRKHTR